MLISKTYLNQYEKIIKEISIKVNKYLQEAKLSNKMYAILPSFYLRFLSNKTPYYSEIIFIKNKKTRILSEPSLELKYIQKYILHNILYRHRAEYKLDKCITGFLQKKSILDNARPHLNRLAIIKMDIKDFFPSITRKMIYNIFRKYNKFSYEYSYILSHLVTYKNVLPQGTPTSPFLANICAKGIDYKINKLIEVINKRQKMNIAYTRYADDITISFDKKFNYDYMVNIVTNIIFDEGFYPNLQKTHSACISAATRSTSAHTRNKLPPHILAISASE
ncbi:MAG: reverse transcriptase family protein [Sulfurovum sp.]